MSKPVLFFGARAPLAALAKAHVQGFTRKDGAFVAEHDDKRVAKPAKGAPPVKPLHHNDLQEGDEIKSPDGEKHEFLSRTKGLNRHVIETRSGNTFPTKSDGTLPGWSKTGRNNKTGAGH